MTTIPGASQYLNTVKVANAQGKTASAPTMLGGATGDLGNGILSVGRQAYAGNGVGLSARSRAYANQFISAVKSGFNSIFGMSTIKTSSVENMLLQINALRAKTPDSQLAQSVRGREVDELA